VLSGFDLMPEGNLQKQLRERTDRVFFGLFAGRIIDLDLASARLYGTVLRERKSMGRPIDEIDALIAATARANGATLATRNTADFEDCGIALVNPWLAD
jgi:predicted nucleic acid-binding protein